MLSPSTRLRPGTRVSGRCEWLLCRLYWSLVTPGVLTCAVLTRRQGTGPSSALVRSSEPQLRPDCHWERSWHWDIRDIRAGAYSEWWDSVESWRHSSAMSRRKQGIVPKKSDQEDQEQELRNGDTATESEQGERAQSCYCFTLLIVTVFQLFPTGVKTYVKPVKCVKLMSSEILKSPILKWKLTYFVTAVLKQRTDG